MKLDWPKLIVAFFAGCMIGVGLATLARAISLSSATAVAWVDALGGWAAALGTAVGILLIIRQVRLQQSQTDFSLGDTPPELNAVRHFSNRDEVIATVINWNRRNVLVSGINISNVNGRTICRKVEIGDEQVIASALPVFNPPLIVNGLVNRSEGPKILKFKLICVAQDGKSITDWGKAAEVVIDFHIIGSVVEREKLRGPIYVAEN